MAKSPSVTVYTYAKCSTCRNAVKWLQANGITFVERPIRETPPSVAELKRMLAAQGGAIRKLFNSSGDAYRAQGIAEKLPSLSMTEALELLASDGHLVKRPFLLGPGETGLVGFDETRWSAALVTG